MFTKELSKDIENEFEKVAFEFSSFQKQKNLSCLPGCGKCCFKKDVSCAPIELLPMALELLKRGAAEKFYDLALEQKDERCLFLLVDDEEKGMGKCSEYQHRPLICRSFAVAPRKAKNFVEYSVCKTLKDSKTEDYQKLVAEKEFDDSLPYIDILKARLTSIHPAFLEEELPINQALIVILEKVLINHSLRAEEN